MAPVSVTFSDLKPRFQNHDIIQRQITQKWYKMELYLQWLTNSKSYMVYRCHSLTLNISETVRHT